MPCAQHPHAKTLTPFERRLAMVDAVFGGLGDAVEVSAIEQDLARRPDAKGYTLDLLRELQTRCPGERFQLLVGGDIGSELPGWHGADALRAEFAPIVVPRAGAGEASPIPAWASSDIRAAVAAGNDALVRDAIPEPARVLMQPAERSAWVVGRGRLGTAAARWLRRHGVAVRALGGRESLPGEGTPPDFVWVAVADAALPEVARRLAEALDSSVPVLHAAGALRAADALAPLAAAGHAVGTLHPMCAVNHGTTPRELDRCRFGLEVPDGFDPDRALPWVRIGLDLTGLDAYSRARYHAGCALAANHLAVLARTASRTCDPDPRTRMSAVLALMESSLRRLRVDGFPGGVTGPAVRGDVTTVARHKEVLDPDVAELYGALSEMLEQELRGR